VPAASIWAIPEDVEQDTPQANEHAFHPIQVLVVRRTVGYVARV